MFTITISMITAILLLVLLFFLFILYVKWQVHKDMVIDSCDNYTHGTLKEFYKEFHKYDWKKTREFSDSYFGVGSTKTRIHASIISFNGYGIVLDPISFMILEYRLRFNKMPPLKKEDRVAYLRDKFTDKIL